jgi:hypothetical protein
MDSNAYLVCGDAKSLVELAAHVALLDTSLNCNKAALMPRVTRDGSMLVQKGCEVVQPKSLASHPPHSHAPHHSKSNPCNVRRAIRQNKAEYIRPGNRDMTP